MNRRAFTTLITGAAAAWPLAVRAQQSGKVYRIGFLGVTSHAEYSDRVEAVRAGLRRLGYEEGKNIVIHYRWADGRYERLPDLAAELVQLNVDVIVTHSTPGSRAAKHATSTIPIVANSGDPVEAGLVDSLARPGGNLTGTTFFFAEICAKRVELIKEAIPAMTRLAVLVNPANSSNRIALSAMQHTARALQVELVPLEIKVRDDIAAAMATVVARHAPALVVVEDPVSISNDRWTAELALQNKLPMIGFKSHAQAGALMDYGVDVTDQFYRLAAFVDKIFKGNPPADLPIERAVKFDLVVNLKSAKTLGIELPASLLIRADEVIE
jgi:putative ABC transport system substrate-binding protein